MLCRSRLLWDCSLSKKPISGFLTSAEASRGITTLSFNVSCKMLLEDNVLTLLNISPSGCLCIIVHHCDVKIMCVCLCARRCVWECVC